MAIKDPKELAEIAGLTPEQLARIEAHYAEEAAKKKTEQITMRITARFKTDVKKAAEKQGFSKYQQWINKVLYDAVAQALPEKYADPGDDF